MLNLDDAKHLYEIGYYKCNEMIFYSKIKACIYATQINKPVEWIYNDALFDSYNWQVEPQGTLDELYNKRARDLREKYDYLVLSFSGGSDSYNVLMSFVRQGLYIDEIVTNHLTKGTEKLTVHDINNKYAWNLNAEHQLQAVPRLKEIEKICPKTKITVLDTTDVTLDELQNKKDDWVDDRKDNLTFAMFHRYNHFYFSSIKKQFDKNLKIAIITGLDKPRTFLQGDKLYYTIYDTGGMNMSGIHDHNEYPNASVEHFYWGKDAINLMCKQAHVIKRWLKINPVFQRTWRDNSFLTWRISREKITRDIVYTTWNKDWYQVNKATGGWHNEFDRWAHLYLKDTKEIQIWNEGIDYVAKSASNFIQYNKNGLPDTLKSFNKTFYIGDINNNY